MKKRSQKWLCAVILVLAASVLMGCGTTTHSTIDPDGIPKGDAAHDQVVELIGQAVEAYNQKHTQDTCVPEIDSWEMPDDYWDSDIPEFVEMHAASHTEIVDIEYKFWFSVYQDRDGQYHLRYDDLDELKSNVDLDFGKLAGFSSTFEVWNSEVEVQFTQPMPISLQNLKYGYTPLILTLTFDAGDGDDYTYSGEVALYLPDSLDYPYEITNLRGKMEDGSGYYAELYYSKYENDIRALHIYQIDGHGNERHHYFVIE